MEEKQKLESSKLAEIWSPQPTSRHSYDSDSNPFEEERSVAKIKPEVEMKEETDGFVYKADSSGHLKLVCSSADLTSIQATELNVNKDYCCKSSQFNAEEGGQFKSGFVPEEIESPLEHLKNPLEMNVEPPIDEPRYQSNYSLFGHSMMPFPSEDKYIDSFQVSQAEYAESLQQKLFPSDDNFHNRCCSEFSDDCNKLSYIETDDAFSDQKLVVAENQERSWIYNMQAVRLTEDVINVSGLTCVKDTFADTVENNKRLSSDSEADLWQLYQELLMQKKMEGKLAQTDEQKKEKLREIGRIRARLYRAKLKQDDEVWKRHKAIRAQKQREERLKMSEEQREKSKALARIRAKKHREKLKNNETAWKKYKDARSEKQRLERIKAKEENKEEEQKVELMQLAEQSEKNKELARERAKKHRERLKEDANSWMLYKKARAQRKREERLLMSNDQRDKLKELARIRAKKYREKLKGNADDWKKYKEMRARKQREDRLKLKSEDKLKAKELARERAKLYREKKKRSGVDNFKTIETTTDTQRWLASNNEKVKTTSTYFYQSFIPNVSKDSIEQ